MCFIFISTFKKPNFIFRGTFHKNNSSLSPDELIIKLKHHLNHSLSDFFNLFRVSLLTMNNYNPKNTFALLQDDLNNASNSICCQLILLSP